MKFISQNKKSLVIKGIIVSIYALEKLVKIHENEVLLMYSTSKTMLSCVNRLKLDKYNIGQLKDDRYYNNSLGNVIKLLNSFITKDISTDDLSAEEKNLSLENANLRKYHYITVLQVYNRLSPLKGSNQASEINNILQIVPVKKVQFIITQKLIQTLYLSYS